MVVHSQWESAVPFTQFFIKLKLPTLRTGHFPLPSDLTCIFSRRIYSTLYIFMQFHANVSFMLIYDTFKYDVQISFPVIPPF